MKNQFLLINKKSTTYKFSFEDIMYITTGEKAHKLKMVTKDGIYNFYGNLKELENITPVLFRCHKSNLVNLQNVKKIDYKKRQLSFENPKIEAIPYSRRITRSLLSLWLNN